MFEGDEIVLVVQSDAQNRVQVRTFEKAPFRNLFEKYRSHAIRQGTIDSETKLSFQLDGQPLFESQTAESLDLESEDIIDVYVST